MHEQTADHQQRPLDATADLGTVLTAWNDATQRLQHTHEALRAEVRRLTDELERKNRELARKNRLADLGRIAAHVAHEVRNNLVPVSLYLSLLRRRLADDAGSLAVLTKVEAGFTALDATVNDLLHFTVQREAAISLVPVRKLIDDVLSQLEPQLTAQGIDVALDVQPRDVVPADREMLRRAILNLALNAIDAMPDGGQIHFTAWQDDQFYELEVADSGPGLSEEARRRAFEPFFTTKNTGTGLGLAIVYRVAEAHGGSVLAQNCADCGAAFTIRLPRRQCMEAAA
jgi:signal transduction histidine kinase